MSNLTLDVQGHGKIAPPSKLRPEGSIFVAKAKVWYGGIWSWETYWLHPEDVEGTIYTLWYESEELLDEFYCCARYEGGNRLAPEEVAREIMVALWEGRYPPACGLDSFGEGGLLSKQLLDKLADEYNERLKPPKVRRGTRALHGELLYEDTGKVRYRGLIRDGLAHGKGVGYWANGNAWCDGSFRNHEPHGHCRIHFPDGTLRYEGTMKDGHPCGRGREYYDNGRIWFDGIFGREPSIYYGYGGRHWVRGRLYDREGNLTHRGRYRFNGKGSEPITPA